MSKILPIIITRFNSRRLKGKSLLKINGKTIIEIIAKQLSNIPGLQKVVVATSNTIDDNIIGSFCKKKKIKIFRGSLNNVAKRVYECAKKFNCDYILRLNADSPFIDQSLIKSAVRNITLTKKYVYHTNILRRTYPKGISLEIFNTKYLRRQINKYSNNKNYLEHISPLFLKDKEGLSIYKNYSISIKSKWKNSLTIDVKKDFIIIKTLIENINIFQRNFKWNKSLILLKYLRH